MTHEICTPERALEEALKLAREIKNGEEKRRQGCQDCADHAQESVARMDTKIERLIRAIEAIKAVA